MIKKKYILNKHKHEPYIYVEDSWRYHGFASEYFSSNFIEKDLIFLE